MYYTIKKTPVELTRIARKSRFPLEDLKVGEMFEAKSNDRNGVYNAIKHRTKYTKEFEGRKFRIKTIDNKNIVVMRIA